MAKKTDTVKILEKVEEVKITDKRARISQSDVPAYGLSDALRVARAILENYAGDPTKPLDVAAAMSISPNSSTFKMLAGASIAYGLTEGGYNASSISVTNLAKRIVTPLEENDDLLASREALIKPRIIGDFLQKYDGKQIPKEDIAGNVVAALGCPRDRTNDVFKLISEEAGKLGLITEIKGKQYVNLKGAAHRNGSEEIEKFSTNPTQDEGIDDFTRQVELPTKYDLKKPFKEINTRRVFITHGKNKVFVDPIKRLLTFGEMEPVVSVESQSVSLPVPEKVMSDMRSCSAAIIHVAAEQILMDSDANEHAVLNPNVLIEIGAAMALFGKRFILLVREGVKLPSNLQGLYEVRYTSDQLDGDATIRLMEAIKALKETPIPL